MSGRVISSDSSRARLDVLTPLLYDELHEIAGRYLRDERRHHTLHPTALVNEAYLRLASWPEAEFRDRIQFLAAAATAMRRILINHALARRAAKRGGVTRPAPLDDTVLLFEQRSVDLVLLDAALEQLAQVDADQARIVELRFFGGLTIQETAQALHVSHATVEREWSLARAWLRRAVEES
ncbi:MAG: ECF-type sigma factor [Planctomycetota bacterium]